MIGSSKLKTFSHNTIVLVAFYFISRLYVTGYWPSGCVYARPALYHWSTCSPSCCLESICHCSPFGIHTIPFHFSCTGSFSLFLCSLFLILLTLLSISVSPPPYSSLLSWMRVYLYLHHFMDVCVFVLPHCMHFQFTPYLVLFPWWSLFWWFPRLHPRSSTVI